MSTEPVSLHAFCRDNDLSKTTVRRWLIDNGYSTSDGLSSEAVEAAKAQFCPQAAPPAPAVGGLTIHTGNPCHTLDTPGFDGLTIDLGQFRDSEALVIDDPLAVAIQFLQTADHIQSALQADIKAREQRLAETKQAQDAIATKAQQLQLEQGRYRLQTAQLNQAQTTETQALAANLAQLQSLGKPTAADSEPT
jgi:hypothetical protein